MWKAYDVGANHPSTPQHSRARTVINSVIFRQHSSDVPRNACNGPAKRLGTGVSRPTCRLPTKVAASLELFVD